MKAIETEYGGYRFRSRLEARWAVFFDAAEIKYEYEPEGFEVEWGENEVYRYLPDFYLPDFDVYAEVKPSKQKLIEDQSKISMCIDFGQTPISSSNGLLILGQIPYYDPWEKFNVPAFNLLWWDSGVLSGLAKFVRGYKTELIYVKDAYCVSSAPELPQLVTGDDLIFMTCGIVKEDSNGLRWRLEEPMQTESAEHMVKCFSKARMARFENGGH